MTARNWVVFLAFVAVVTVGGIFALSSAGVFGPNKSSGPIEPALVATPAPSPTPTQVATTRAPTPTAAAGPHTTAPTESSAVRARYVFPIAGCRADASQSHHDYPPTDI
ncbi:hypothetical protein AB0E57_13215, partial [Micrococcus luteus]